MEDDQQPRPVAQDALFATAHALALTVAALRRACGKSNPKDYLVGSPEWREIAEDFARDVLSALEGGLDDELKVIHRDGDDDYLGIGAAG